MKPLTAEWVKKAEEDFVGAVKLARQRKPPVHNLVCFLCQQCAEKYLKARLQEADIEFPKTHNLTELLELLLPVEPLWETLRVEAQSLTNYAVEFRYPGTHADSAEAKRALAFCRTMRLTVRRSLGLEGEQPEFRVREKKARYRTRRRKK